MKNLILYCPTFFSLNHFFCVYSLRVNNSNKTVPVSLQQYDKGRQFRLQMIISLEGTMLFSRPTPFGPIGVIIANKMFEVDKWKLKCLFLLFRRPVIIAVTYDVAIVCKVGNAQCKTRVQMDRPWIRAFLQISD